MLPLVHYKTTPFIDSQRGCYFHEVHMEGGLSFPTLLPLLCSSPSWPVLFGGGGDTAWVAAVSYFVSHWSPPPVFLSFLAFFLCHQYTLGPCRRTRRWQIDTAKWQARGKRSPVGIQPFLPVTWASWATACSKKQPRFASDTRSVESNAWPRADLYWAWREV